MLVKTTFTDKNEPAGSNEIVTTYTYDDVFKRMSKIVEDKTGVSKFTTTFAYDGLGRIDTETKQAQLGSKISIITSKREYKNGSLYQIVDNTTKKVLWQTNALNAKGQIRESVLGNGIKTTSDYDSNNYLRKLQYDKATGQGTILTLNTIFDFKTDNLENRTNSAFSNYTETFKYDEIDRLKEFTNKLGVQETQNYEPSGKIKDNSLGVYNYSKDKPYQNIAIALTPEALNYYKSRKAIASQTAKIPTPVDSPIALNITYNAFKAPLTIEETGGDRKDIDKISFTYNDDNNRSTMFYAGIQVQKELRALRKHYSADGTMEIKENVVTGAVEFITYIGGDGYSASIVLKSDGLNTANYLYLHRDYQGSILVITDANANVVEKRLFDSWGSIIKVEDGAGNTLTGLTVLDRGYTGHEHLQSVALINMNARLYDPMLHRFLQVDNYIQDATNTQNYNQYGYVLNNPLLYTDPSGNQFNDGKDCKGCGPTEGQQIGAGGIIGTVVNNWDDWGIKDWANKNINGDKISKWWKSKVSFKNFFGGGKSSGPPPNMSTYISVNSGNYSSNQSFALIDRFKKGSNGKYIINPNGKPNFSQEGINEINRAVEGLQIAYVNGGNPKVKFDIKSDKFIGLTNFDDVNLNPNKITTNLRYAAALFHEYRHSWQYSSGNYYYWQKVFGYGFVENYQERDAYWFQIKMGAGSFFEGDSRYVEYRNLTKNITYKKQ